MPVLLVADHAPGYGSRRARLMLTPLGGDMPPMSSVRSRPFVAQSSFWSGAARSFDLFGFFWLPRLPGP